MILLIKFRLLYENIVRMVGKYQWVDPEERTGGQAPTLKNHKNIGFPSNIGTDPLKIPKLPSQNSMLAIISTPAKRHLNGVSLADR